MQGEQGQTKVAEAEQDKSKLTKLDIAGQIKANRHKAEQRKSNITKTKQNRANHTAEEGEWGKLKPRQSRIEEMKANKGKAEQNRIKPRQSMWGAADVQRKLPLTNMHRPLQRLLLDPSMACPCHPASLSHFDLIIDQSPVPKHLAWPHSKEANPTCCCAGMSWALPARYPLQPTSKVEPLCRCAPIKRCGCSLSRSVVSSGTNSAAAQPPKRTGGGAERRVWRAHVRRGGPRRLAAAAAAAAGAAAAARGVAVTGVWWECCRSAADDDDGQ